MPLGAAQAQERNPPCAEARREGAEAGRGLLRQRQIGRAHV